jgi:phosphatidylglycerol:prolipoprotein diacylglycerol transferase
MVPRDLVGVPLQPYAAYEIIFDLALLAVLWNLRKALKVDGVLFAIYAGAYSAGRFLLGFVRMERVWAFGLQEAQVVSVLVLLIAATALTGRLWSTRATWPARNPA